MGRGVHGPGPWIGGFAHTPGGQGARAVDPVPHEGQGGIGAGSRTRNRQGLQQGNRRQAIHGQIHCGMRGRIGDSNCCRRVHTVGSPADHRAGE